VFDDETPIAWSALRPGAAAVTADGGELGTVHEVLGDVDEDIFHSVVVKRASDGEAVEIPAERIKRLTERHVVTDLDGGDAGALPEYRQP